MSASYFAGEGRPPFDANGRLVARRERTYGDKLCRIGDEVPRGDMPVRTLTLLWEQGWIDTHAQPADPKVGRGGARDARK